MLHAAHINVLEKARTFGDYVIVGVHNDHIVNSKRGMNLPILNMHERVLSLLGCKFVDDVLIDAPYVLTKEMIDSLNISVVLKGHAENNNIYEKDHFRHLHVEPSPEKHNLDDFDDPYAVPRELGILKSVESKSTLTILDIVERVIAQRDRFSKKYQSKSAQEEEYYNNKYSKSKNE
jgi:ethanolamine-phosphate cytidylyltransferase